MLEQITQEVAIGGRQLGDPSVAHGAKQSRPYTTGDGGMGTEGAFEKKKMASFYFTSRGFNPGFLIT